VKVSSVRARIRRDVKATLQRVADAVAYTATAAQRATEDFAAARDEAHAEQAPRRPQQHPSEGRRQTDRPGRHCRGRRVDRVARIPQLRN
jgi:uncharacterized protein (DUF2345 family)